MRGRILSIKKSTWLLMSMILNIVIFIGGSIFAFTYLNQYDYWFFIFCVCIGFHLILKGILFRFDSSCYFGLTLFLIGIFYFYSLYFNIIYLYPVFIMLSFCISSLFIFYFFKQPYHLILSFSLFFASIGLLFYLINIISIPIFLAIVLACVILLVVKYFTLK